MTPYQHPHMFVFPARCVNVVDGDTIDVVLDCGLHVHRTERLRLLGVNCPELHAADPIVRFTALEAKNFTSDTIDEWQSNDEAEWPLLVETFKADAFGRYLANVTSRIFHSDTLSNEIIATGHGVAFMVGKP